MAGEDPGEIPTSAGRGAETQNDGSFENDEQRNGIPENDEKASGQKKRKLEGSEKEGESAGSGSLRKGKREVQANEMDDDEGEADDVADGPFPSMLGDEGADVAGRTVDVSLVAVLEAAEAGDLPALKEALSCVGCSLDSLGPEGETALHLACLYGHRDCVEALLEAGATVDVRDEDGSTPLHDACASGFVEIARALIGRIPAEHVKDMVNSRDSDGDTPLHNASRGGHPSLVKLLLEHGADATALNGSGETPAMVAEDSEEARDMLDRAENGV